MWLMELWCGRFSGTIEEGLLSRLMQHVEHFGVLPEGYTVLLQHNELFQFVVHVQNLTMLGGKWIR